jgi:hypothetical protein
MAEFNNSVALGIRDVAAVCEDCSTMRIGPTHLARLVMDPEYGDRFQPLIRSLVHSYCEELTK